MSERSKVDKYLCTVCGHRHSNGWYCKAHIDRLTARVAELEAENRSLQTQNEQLQDKADAYDVLQWLIGEGYHDFRWDYNSDTEILSLESSGLSVELSLHGLKHDSTAMSLGMLKALAAPREAALASRTQTKENEQ